MPEYDYECKRCAQTFTRMVTVANRRLVRCPSCHRRARILIVAPNISLFKPFLCENFGLEPVWIGSRRQLVEEHRKRDLPVVM